MNAPIQQWHDYTEVEKILWLKHNVLKLGAVVSDDHVQDRYDMVLVNRCEQALTQEQRDQYIKYMNSDIALLTYTGLSDEEQQSEATADKFYWNYLTAPHDLRARCIWNVVMDYAP